MGILGISNRTENWKTAEHFYGLSKPGRGRLVEKLSRIPPAGEIKLELFWYGMRDYIHQYDGGAEEVLAKVADIYSHKFSNLRGHIEKSKHRFGALKPHNYKGTPKNEEKLLSNLLHTEIDVVLETSDHLFIGEAKDESKFGADGKHVLVHQLIRQYVTAKVLVCLKGKEKKVVPFIVGDKCKLDSIKRTSQVRFMIDQCWLKECNILSWDYIKELGKQ